MQAKEEVLTEKQIEKIFAASREYPVYRPHSPLKMEDLTEEQREEMERTRISVRKTLTDLPAYIKELLETTTHQQDSGNQ